MSADTFLQRVWYGGHPLSVALLPLSWLFRAVVFLRRAAYRRGFFASYRVGRPVIVVGNITVGGTGKTPFTAWLCDELQRRGLKVGIVLRGYGGRSTHWPRDVEADTPWQEVGDEPAMLARQTGAIVVVGPDRVAAVNRAIAQGAEVVLCDDGLQHYRLQRDCEIAVLDARRGLGNARALPAGPLRESPRRLAEVNLVVATQRDAHAVASVSTSAGVDQISVTPTLTRVRRICDGKQALLASLAGQQVHAVAGIGNPQGFFAALDAAGLKVQSRALPDHARITRSDIFFDDDVPVLMTEKDAVKCRDIVDARHWEVLLDLQISETDAAVVHSIIQRVLKASRPGS